MICASLMARIELQADASFADIRARNKLGIAIDAMTPCRRFAETETRPILEKLGGGLARPKPLIHSSGCPAQALLGRGVCLSERMRTVGTIPSLSRRRAVHWDSISTTPSAPVR